jgi:hypothetical protein
MASKSPLNIIEDALTAALSAEPGLAGFTVFKGEAATELTLPSIIVSCESAQKHPDIAQGLGNYLCKVNVGVFNSLDDDTLTTHRNATQDVMGVLDNVTTIKAAFTTIGDASCYDTTLNSIDEGRGDRAFMTTLDYEVLIVLPPA